MFLTESTNIFHPSTMKIRITFHDGTNIIAAFHPETTIDKLKVFALTQFTSNELASLKESLYYKVVLVRTCTSLEDDKSFEQQGVLDNDEVLLLKRRLCHFDKAQDRMTAEEFKRGPSFDEISKATSSVSSSEEPFLNIATISSAMDYQMELKRILISLIEVSQKLLCLNPEAAHIFQQAEEILNEPTREPTVDEADLKVLVDMGFSETRAKKALLLNKLSVMSAMEWLLQHENDPDIDTPPSDDQSSSQSADQPPANGNTSDVITDNDEEKGAVGYTPTAADGTALSHCRVSNILKSLRAYRRREFKPNPKTLQHLLEMGFEESDIIDALRATRNDGDAACDMLLGNKKPPPEEVYEGIEFDSPLFKAIMANPTVQLGLNNPRCLLAFIQMLEHPHTATQWLGDPETAPLLVQISRIYHAEKNSEMQQNHEAKRRKDKTAQS